MNDKVGEFPKKFNATMDKLEDNLNEFNDTLNDTNEKIDKMNRRLDNFYGKIIEIFGVFIALFALILTTGNNISIVKGDTIVETTLNAFYYLLPLTAVLLVFVVLLNWLRRK